MTHTVGIIKKKKKNPNAIYKNKFTIEAKYITSRIKLYKGNCILIKGEGG